MGNEVVCPGLRCLPVTTLEVPCPTEMGGVKEGDVRVLADAYNLPRQAPT
jgi:hypothetical protein